MRYNNQSQKLSLQPESEEDYVFLDELDDKLKKYPSEPVVEFDKNIDSRKKKNFAEKFVYFFNHAFNKAESENEEKYDRQAVRIKLKSADSIPVTMSPTARIPATKDYGSYDDFIFEQQRELKEEKYTELVQDLQTLNKDLQTLNEFNKLNDMLAERNQALTNRKGKWTKKGMYTLAVTEKAVDSTTLTMLSTTANSLPVGSIVPFYLATVLAALLKAATETAGILGGSIAKGFVDIAAFYVGWKNSIAGQTNTRRMFLGISLAIAAASITVGLMMIFPPAGIAVGALILAPTIIGYVGAINSFMANLIIAAKAQSKKEIDDREKQINLAIAEENLLQLHADQLKIKIEKLEKKLNQLNNNNNDDVALINIKKELANLYIEQYERKKMLKVASSMVEQLEIGHLLSVRSPGVKMAVGLWVFAATVCMLSAVFFPPLSLVGLGLLAGVLYVNTAKALFPKEVYKKMDGLARVPTFVFSILSEYTLNKIGDVLTRPFRAAMAARFTLADSEASLGKKAGAVIALAVSPVTALLAIPGVLLKCTHGLLNTVCNAITWGVSFAGSGFAKNPNLEPEGKYAKILDPVFTSPLFSEKGLLFIKTKPKYNVSNSSSTRKMTVAMQVVELPNDEKAFSDRQAPAEVHPLSSMVLPRQAKKEKQEPIKRLIANSQDNNKQDLDKNKNPESLVKVSRKWR